MTENISFNHNFGGRASATHLAAVVVVSSAGRVLHTIPDPSEFRVRENGTVTIYSRKHGSTSVYGMSTQHRTIVGITREGNVVVTLKF